MVCWGFSIFSTFVNSDFDLNKNNFCFELIQFIAWSKKIFGWLRCFPTIQMGWSRRIWNWVISKLGGITTAIPCHSIMINVRWDRVVHRVIVIGDFVQFTEFLGIWDQNVPVFAIQGRIVNHPCQAFVDSTESRVTIANWVGIPGHFLNCRPFLC